MGGGFSRAIRSVVKPLLELFSNRPARPPPHVEKLARPPPPPPPPPPPVEKLVTPPPPPQKSPPPPDMASVQKKKSVREIVEEARKQIGVDCINHYNFGVCGQSGVGKSSFINGFLGLEGDDACSVGEVETTQKMKRYSTKKTPYLMVWDIPGAGTTNHPADTYFEDKKLYVFDAILILSSERFLKVDFDVLRSARKYETPCVFVRTKCDIGVESKALRARINAVEASKRFREDVRANFLESLANVGLHDSSSTPELFFISNRFFSDDDAYTLYDKKTRAWDTSLSSMDELQLTSFIHNTAKRRAYPPK